MCIRDSSLIVAILSLRQIHSLTRSVYSTTNPFSLQDTPFSISEKSLEKLLHISCFQKNILFAFLMLILYNRLEEN